MLSPSVSREFELHAARLKDRARARRDAVSMKSVVHDKEDREEASVEDSLGKKMPADEFQGDVNLRTLRALLKMVDERGFERCVCKLHPNCVFT